MLERGISEEKINFYLENYNSLANLQLLERTPNTEKSNKDFKEWLDETCSGEQARRDFLQKNFIPDIDLNLSNFEAFIEKRTDLMREKFKNLLQL